MAELNLHQITDRLNAEFSGEGRRLIFWYDADAEFAEDVDSLEIENAKVYHLRPDNQFRTKVFLEREDRETNYLVYAPFAKPDVRDNHLWDMIRYSKEFYADRASLLTTELGIDDRYKSVIREHIRFFGEKRRLQAFVELGIEPYNRATIETGMMAVLCKCRTPSFEEVLRYALHEWNNEESSLLKEFEKYALTDAFWQQCDAVLGYTDQEPTLARLCMTLFVTYASRCIHAELPVAWRPFESFKSGSVLAFMDNLMNNALYSDLFNHISVDIGQKLGAAEQLAKLPVESLAECNLFAEVDRLLIGWCIDRLMDENVSALLDGRSIEQLCRERARMHFGERYDAEYRLLRHAQALLQPELYHAGGSAKGIAEDYVAKYYRVDRHYREFYHAYDRVEDAAPFEQLRELVERVYTNDYLNTMLANFTGCFTDEEGRTGLPLQQDFYRRYLANCRERTVVIISDAMRYEVGAELYERLQADERCTATIGMLQSTLPSITCLGMAALLPHKQLSYSDGKVLADGMPTDTLAARDALLKQYRSRSRAVRYDDIKGMKQTELRDIFTGMDVVYVYHNQIDARGDNASSENEVFRACREAVEEIHTLIRKLNSMANTTHFIVTADHGFLYKRDRLTEGDKISGVPDASKRYAVTCRAVPKTGVGYVPFANIVGGETPEVVCYPLGSDLFKAPGAGLNYVHGGCSPQELLVPLIEVKTEKSKREVTNASIVLVSLVTRITGLITSLDFMQSEPVSDVVKETTLHVYFVDEAGERISNENLYSADRTDKDATKRMFRLRFSFKNRKYDRFRKYFLVVMDEKTGVETLRHEVVMDIAFADDFGF